MGQYYKIVNIDKKEYINPHDFSDGAKLLEFGSSGEGTMLGLAVLLSHGNGRGGGDIEGDSSLIGSWAGDRIVIAGDYADPNYFLTPDEIKNFKIKYLEEEDEEYKNEKCTLYRVSHYLYKNISEEVVKILIESGDFPQKRIDGIARMKKWKINN